MFGDGFLRCCEIRRGNNGWKVRSWEYNLKWNSKILLYTFMTLCCEKIEKFPTQTSQRRSSHKTSSALRRIWILSKARKLAVKFVLETKCGQQKNQSQNHILTRLSTFLLSHSRDGFIKTRVFSSPLISFFWLMTLLKKRALKLEGDEGEDGGLGVFGVVRCIFFWLPLPQRPIAVVSFVLTDLPPRISEKDSALPLSSLTSKLLFARNSQPHAVTWQKLSTCWPQNFHLESNSHFLSRLIRTRFVLRMKIPLPMASQALARITHMHGGSDGWGSWEESKREFSPKTRSMTDKRHKVVLW